MPVIDRLTAVLAMMFSAHLFCLESQCFKNTVINTLACEMLSRVILLYPAASHSKHVKLAYTNIADHGRVVFVVWTSFQTRSCSSRAKNPMFCDKCHIRHHTSYLNSKTTIDYLQSIRSKATVQ